MSQKREVQIIEIIPSMPENIVAVNASGKVTGEDYDNVLMPAIEDKLNECVRVLDKPPKTTVIGVVPVVTHYEIVIGRDSNRSEIIPGGTLPRQDLRIIMHLVWVPVQDTVHINLIVPDQNLITGDADHFFDEILWAAHRTFENNHIPPLWISQRRLPRIGKGDFDAVYELVNKYVVTNQKCIFR